MVVFLQMKLRRGGQLRASDDMLLDIAELLGVFKSRLSFNDSDGIAGSVVVVRVVDGKPGLGAVRDMVPMLAGQVLGGIRCERAELNPIGAGTDIAEAGTQASACVKASEGPHTQPQLARAEHTEPLSAAESQGEQIASGKGTSPAVKGAPVAGSLQRAAQLVSTKEKAHVVILLQMKLRDGGQLRASDDMLSDIAELLGVFKSRLSFNDSDGSPGSLLVSEVDGKPGLGAVRDAAPMLVGQMLGGIRCERAELNPIGAGTDIAEAEALRVTIPGERWVTIRGPSSLRHEAREVVAAVQDACARHPQGEVLVLFRHEQHSLILEEHFRVSGVPFHMAGGTQTFFERKEVAVAVAVVSLTWSTFVSL